MIGKMYGIIDEIHSDHIILKVKDIGYIVYVPRKTINKLKQGKEISLYILQHFYENGQKLYGTTSHNEKHMLINLATVKGISYKIAINILDNLSIDDILNAIQTADEKKLQVPGIGPKIAKRIVTEMKDIALNNIAYDTHNASQNKTKLIQEAKDVLTNLGYSQNTIQNALNNVYKQQPKIKEIEQIIKLALKYISVK